MPGTTPNRGYPYPVSTDPVDVPRDIERLAEAWDDDLTLVNSDIVARPGFRVFSSTPQTFPVFVSSAFTMSFNQVDYNIGGAIDTSSGASQLVFTPQLPGIWYLTTAASYARPSQLPSPNFDEFGISIQSGATVLAKRNTHSEPVAGENRTLAVGTIVFLDGNTSVQAVWTANRTTTIPFYSVYNRSFTGFRMTES